MGLTRRRASVALPAVAARLTARSFLSIVSLLAGIYAMSVLTPSSDVEAQGKPKVYRIGLLWGTPAAQYRAELEQGLLTLGWIDGKNVALEFRSAQGHLDRLPGLARELAASKVDMIVALAAPETSAAMQATDTIPIVFIIHGDPVGTGAVQTLSRPGGNVTGTSQMHSELAAKQLQILKQLVPAASRIAVLWNATAPAKAADWRTLTPAAQALHVGLESREVRRPGDFEAAFATIKQSRPDAMLVLSDPLVGTWRASIAEFAARERLPAMYALRVYAEGGGLISYGADIADLHRRAAGYVDKILRGARPADLPVEQAQRFELVINMKAAKALALSVPESLLRRADHVIE